MLRAGRIESGGEHRGHLSAYAVCSNEIISRDYEGE